MTAASGSTLPQPPARLPDRPGARIAVVGAGPVGVGLVERLLANAPVLAPGRALEIVLVDPFPPGAGRVWRTGQSPLMRMNSPARDVTLFPDESVECAGPVRPGPALDAWAAATAAGELPPVADERLRDDVPPVGPRSFAPRRLQGAYLTWFLHQLAGQAPPGVRVFAHAGRATALERRADGRQLIRTADGAGLPADAVVLALGHVDARPSGRDAELAAFAAENGLLHLPPGYAADLDLSAVPAGADVVVRGLGLAFFDFMALLTEGRGGRYVREPGGALRYLPSGREPRLYAGSRRGLPYRCKPRHTLLAPKPEQPRHFTDAAVDSAAARAAAERRPVDFRRELWPLLAKELRHAYYRELFTAQPRRTAMSWAEFESRHDAADTPEATAALVAAAVPDSSDRLDLDELREPLRGLTAPTPEALQKHLCAHLERDLARNGDPACSADTALYSALLMLFGRLPRVRPLLSARSQTEDLDGAWFSLFNFVASGPPAFRAEELLALCRSGVVTFLGSGTRVEADRTRGVFRARGANAPGEVTARVLIDARLPAPTVEHTADPLLGALRDAGEAAEEVLADPSGGYRHPTGRIAVDPEGRLLDTAGRPQPARFALGWNTSLRGARAFALPRTNAITFRHGDLVARAVLRGLPGGTD
ncbi:FAD/NAD(P)-binding protein [Streptomyces lycii]|uniref:FAD/NAD(P)-binding protein n=2 Tax=Streptomyces TaxID=1883 RepID=UPI001F18E578|nr:FAD/NAD(P)-binding protein [Streptomyces lycii]